MAFILPPNKTKRLLAYEFERALAERVEEYSLHEIVTELLDLLPEQTFDATQPFDVGHLTYSGAVYDGLVNPFSEDLYRVHLNLDPSLPIEITLNSEGGEVYSGQHLIGAIQALQEQGRVVNMTVQGLAASMGSIVLQVATTRRMSLNSSLMLHEVSSRQSGKLSQLTEDNEATRRLQERMFSYYSARTGKSVEYYFEKLKKRDLWMDAQEALAEGLIDEVLPVPTYKVTPPVESEVKKRRVRKSV